MFTISEIGQTLKEQPRKFYLKTITVLALSLMGLVLPSFFAGNVQGVHSSGLFELDGNVVDDAGDGPDWGSIFDSSGTVVNLFGGLAATFLIDDVSTASATDKTTFSGAGGSNKNNDPLSAADCAARIPPLLGSACDTWHWDSGNVPSKDDFVRGYAYAKNDPVTGHLIIYVGFERRVSNGDSHIDIEFTQSAIGLDKTPPCGSDLTAGPTDGKPCEFTGIRTVGDFIVSMDFTTGGDLGTVSVHKWNGLDYCSPAGASGCPALETLTAPAVCTADDFICGLNNAGTISNGPWASGTLEKNKFSEFGVDVPGVLGSTPCISQINGHTRSSQSFTAELKDFAGPFPFEICDLGVTKTGPAFSKPGDTVTYTYNVTNKGGVTLFKQSIVDNVTGTLTSNCGASLAPKAFCVFTADHLVTGSDTDPLVNEVTATYNEKADGSGFSLVRKATHSVDLVHPDYTLTKSASPTEAAVGQTITYTFVIHNTGDVGLVRVSVIDTLLGDISADFPTSLAAGSAPVTVTEFRAILATDPSPLVNSVTATYGLDPATALPNQLARSATANVTITRPVVKITAFGYENVPTAPLPDSSGIVSGHVTYTVKVMNFGPARAVLNGSLVVTTDASSGSLTCTGGSTLAITGTVEANGAETKTFTLECDYTSLNDGAAVQADLMLTYKSESAGSPTFEASGSPATIVFHVQSD